MREEQGALLVAACRTGLADAADPVRAAEAARFFPSNPPILGAPGREICTSIP